MLKENKDLFQKIKEIKTYFSENSSKDTQDVEPFDFEEWKKFITEFTDALAQLKSESNALIAQKLDELTFEIQNELTNWKQKTESNIRLPKDGEDYVLTETDKQEIAKSIPVPIVEKVIEKTEIIKEQPIVKEIAVPEELKAKTIADRLNTTEESVDIQVIKGLQKTIEDLKRAIRQKEKGGGGGGMGNAITQSTAISSATTTITLESRVASNGKAIWLNYQGQQQAYGVNFTVSGKVVTLLFTPSDNTYADIIYIRA